MTEKFGISPALTTPYRPDDTVDTDRLAAHLNDLLSRGCSSGTVFGTTGEGPSVGVLERDRTAAALVAAGIPANRIVEGVIACSREEAAEGVKRAMKRGARGVLLAPPFYFRETDDDALFSWFSSVFKDVGPGLRDVILYHIPSMTGVPLSLSLVGRLRKAFPGAILGVKDSSGDEEGTMRLIQAHGDAVILVGDERYLGRACAAGAQGSICGIGNVLPEKLVATVVNGKDDPEVVAFVAAVCDWPIIPAVKAIVAHARRDPAFARPRAPLVELSQAGKDALGRHLDRLLPKARAA